MIRPLDLLEATRKAVDMFGDECNDADSGIDFAWALMSFLPASEEEFERFDELTVAKVPNVELLHELGATHEAADVYEDIQEAAKAGFSYGEILDDVEMRVLPTAEASA